METLDEIAPLLSDKDDHPLHGSNKCILGKPTIEKGMLDDLKTHVYSALPRQVHYKWTAARRSVSVTSDVVIMKLHTWLTVYFVLSKGSRYRKK